MKYLPWYGHSHYFITHLTELLKWYGNKNAFLPYIFKPHKLLYVSLTIQFDNKHKKTFLKRSHCDTVSETDLYIGNIISVFGRDLKLIEYLTEATKVELMKKSER